MSILKLINLKTGEEIKPDRNNKLIIKNGVRKGEYFVFSHLEAPSKENRNKGLVVGKKTGMSWNQYYPEVFDGKIITVENANKN